VWRQNIEAFGFDVIADLFGRGESLLIKAIIAKSAFLPKSCDFVENVRPVR
jgi:hypothetical protein